MGRLALLAAGIAAAGAAVAVTWVFVLRDAAEPVSVDDVVETAAGRVDVYRTRGSEEIDALLGSRHEYPAETTLTTTRADDCVLYRWDALRDRSTTWEVCPAPDGSWTIRGYRETHRFLGSTEQTAYRCEPGSIWRPSLEAPGTTFGRRCATADTVESARGEVVGEDADGLHVRLDLTLEGRTRGSGSLDLWFRAGDGFPVRIELTNDNRTSSPVGDVRYTEEAELRLVSSATS